MGQESTDRSPGSAKSWEIAAVSASVLVFIFQLIGINPHLSLMDDGARYYLVGLGIWSGMGPRAFWLVDMPWSLVQPLGWPTLVGAVTWPVQHFWSLGAGVVVARILNALLWSVAGYMSYRLFQRFVWPGLALSAAMLTWLSSLGIETAVDLMAEPLFLVLVLLTLDRAIALKRKGAVSTSDAITVAGLAIASFFVRAVGLALLLAILPFLWRHWRWGLGLVAVAVFTWAGLEWLNTSGLVPVVRVVSYSDAIAQGDPFARSSATFSVLGAFLRILGNLYSYAAWGVPSMLFPLWGFPGYRLLLALFYVLLVYGAVVLCLRERFTLVPLAIYSATYMLVVSAGVFVRYLIPMLPILGLLVTAACQGLLTKRSPRVRIVAVATLLVAAVATQLPRAVGEVNEGVMARSEGSGWPYRPEFKPFFEVARWFAANSPTDAAVLVRDGAVFYVASGRQAVDWAQGRGESGDVICKRLKRVAGERPVFVVELVDDDPEWGLVAAIESMRSHCAANLRSMDLYIGEAVIYRFMNDVHPSVPAPTAESPGI